MAAAKRVQAVVIGAGAAGLITARHLLGAGVGVTVLERSDRVGGLWTHHGSPACPLYDSLRTNLPSSVMGLSDMSFPDDVPSFMPHRHVGEFLTKYADVKGVREHVRLQHTVTAVEPLGADDDGPKYRVRASTDGASVAFDADVVVVCNGHYEDPLVPELEGVDRLAGGAFHASRYRRPSQLAGRRVMVVGSGPSGSDLAMELLRSCPAVWLATRDCAPVTEADCASEAEAAGLAVPAATRFPDPFDGDAAAGASDGGGGDASGGGGRLMFCSSPSRVDAGGRVVTAAGGSVAVDTILWCTGYRYRFGAPGDGDLEADLPATPSSSSSSPSSSPSSSSSSPSSSSSSSSSSGFLGPTSVRLEAGGKRVTPLYLGLFAAEEPALALVGIPWRINPMPLFEYQARLVAAVASGATALPHAPSRREEEDAWRRYVREGLGKPDRFAHMLGGLQWEYCRLLHAMTVGRERAEEAHAAWVGLLREGAERGGVAAAGGRADRPPSPPRPLVDAPASGPVSVARVEAGAGRTAEGVETIDVPAALASGFAGAGARASTWGGGPPDRLARDRAVYLDVGAARARDVVGYREREYRFVGGEGPGPGAAGAGAGGLGGGGSAVRVRVEAHGTFAVVVPERGEAGGCGPGLQDQSSKLNATPF